MNTVTTRQHYFYICLRLVSYPSKKSPLPIMAYSIRKEIFDKKNLQRGNNKANFSKRFYPSNPTKRQILYQSLYCIEPDPHTKNFKSQYQGTTVQATGMEPDPQNKLINHNRESDPHKQDKLTSKILFLVPIYSPF